MERSGLHVVMLPWSAFGHLIPFFHLSIALARAKVHVSFVSTPRNIQRLPKIPPEVASFIDFVAIPLPRLDDDLLPEDAEATADVPLQKIQYLKRAVDLLRHPFKNFVAEQSPDWVVVDCHAYWAGEVYQEFQVPVVFFYIFSAVSLIYYGPPEVYAKDPQIMARLSPVSMTSPPEWVDFPSTVALNMHEAKVMYSAFYEANESGISDVERLRRLLLSCQAVAFRSCEEIEGEYLKLCKKLIPPPGISVGLLPPEKPPKSDHHLIEWLDKRKLGSVVYVAFGSECDLTKDQLHEIAHGLELSELPFLWALRQPSWSAEEDDTLPSGFREKTSGRGTTSIGFAPQVEILSHPSIGVSLVHGGWGSIIESLQAGNPLVVMPFSLDQPLNAKLLVEKKMALEIRRNASDGWFSREDIAETLREAMVSEKEGSRVREVAAIVRDEKLQWEQYFGGFVQFLRGKSVKKLSYAEVEHLKI